MKKCLIYLFIVVLLTSTTGCTKKLEKKEYTQRLDVALDSFEKDMTFYMDSNLISMFDSGQFFGEAYRENIQNIIHSLENLTNELDEIGWNAPNKEVQDLQWTFEKQTIKLKEDFKKFTQQKRYKDSWITSLYPSALELEYDLFLMTNESIINMYKALQPLNEYLDQYRSNDQLLLKDSPRSESRMHVLNSLVLHFQTIGLLIAETPTFTQAQILKKDTFNYVMNAALSNNNLISVEQSVYGVRSKPDSYSFYELNTSVLNNIYNFNTQIYSSFYIPSKHVNTKTNMEINNQKIMNYIHHRFNYTKSFFEFDDSYYETMEKTIITGWRMERSYTPPVDDPLYQGYWDLMFTLQRTVQLFTIEYSDGYVLRETKVKEVPALSLSSYPFDQEIKFAKIVRNVELEMQYLN